MSDITRAPLPPIVRLMIHLPPPDRALASWALTLETRLGRVPNVSLMTHGNVPCPRGVSREHDLWEMLDRVVGSHVLG